MFKYSTLLVSVLLAISSTVAVPIAPPADPLAVLPVTVRLNLTDGDMKLPDIDRARAARIFEFGREKAEALTDGVENGVGKRAVSSSSATNVGVLYVSNVNIGTPPTSYTLVIDSGSSNTWVGAGKKYVQTSSSTNTGKNVAVRYGSASFSGTEYTDTVSLGPGLTIENQSIGVASNVQGLSGVDGIMGVGPVDLTDGTVDGEDDIPTVTDNLSSQGKIDTETLAVSFNPSVSRSTATNGELTFGGTDPSKYTGSITYAPITQTSPSSAYWGIDEEIRYGKQQILAPGAGVVDTGTTMLLIASDAFKRYQAATGAVMDKRTGFLSVTMDQFNRMQPLSFYVAGSRFDLIPNAQIWPRALNSHIGGSKDGIYLIVADIGMNSGSGLDVLNGFTFLERFYSVFDTTNNRVGLAYTQNTNSMIN